MALSQEDIDLIKSNLSIRISNEYSYNSHGVSITVDLVYDNEIISSDTTSIYLS